jgi:hypothetical protein
MRDTFRDQAWSEFSSRLYELTVACVRLSRQDNEATRQEHGAAMAEVFFSATALAVPSEDALRAIEILRDSLGSSYLTVQRDLQRSKRIPEPATSRPSGHERLS